MVNFAGLEFIFRFLPVFLVIYYVVPSRGRDYVLLLGSFLFYAMGEPVFLLLLLTLTLVNHFVGRKIKEQQGGYKMFPLQKAKRKRLLIFVLDRKSVV